MLRTFTSTVAEPGDRGSEFGRAHADRVQHTVETYLKVFRHVAGTPVELDGPGADALAAVRAWAPALAEEIVGIADGAGLPVEHVAALNARTEILAAIGTARAGECSTVVLLPEDRPARPVAVQTWDWFAGLRDDWLVWTIPHADGRVTTTLTEYGLVGKMGVNSHRVGVLVNILRHEHDGRSVGVPVHVAWRHALDEGTDLYGAATLLASAGVSASSASTVVAVEGEECEAVTAELHPGGPSWVSPDDDGVLVHTNHFLAPTAAPHDLESRSYPDTVVRLQRLRRRVRGLGCTATSDDVRAVMADHVGTRGAVCCHPDERVADQDAEYATLATVVLDVADGAMRVTPGGPCGRGPGSTTAAS